MTPLLLSLLRSPLTGGPLQLDVTNQGKAQIAETSLVDEAGNRFPIHDGIPRLLPETMLAEQKSEMAARDAQVGDYDRMFLFNLYGNYEIPMTTRALQPQAGDLLLEAGCGTGRMSASFSQKVREVVAVDFSFESLRVNQRKLKEKGITNVHLVQADLCRLPFVSEAFDRVVSCGVYEHIPGPSVRQTALWELARVLKPGGPFVVSAYKHSLFTRIFGQKEGEHAGGIPFFRFTKAELKNELRTAFQVESITGALVYYFLASCRKGTR